MFLGVTLALEVRNGTRANKEAAWQETRLFPPCWHHTWLAFETERYINFFSTDFTALKSIS